MDLKRDVNAARVAFRKGDKEASIVAHSGHREVHDTGFGKYLKSWVYGGLDGIITTFAVVAGVAGAALGVNVILILGFANLIADGISMAIGDYLSTKSENEYYDLERSREKWEVDSHPKGEEAEMLEVYQKKGLNKKDSKILVNVLKRNKKFWIDTMMHDELGLVKEDENPVKHAVVTFGSFLVFGFIPLALFVFGLIFKWDVANGFLWTSVLAGISMFGLGAAKTKITGKKWARSGFETLLIGGVAAGAAYFVGDILAKIV
ncbi:MAG: VIT1/CCC1 transporter family protein [Nanoarchaeota archaeon]|jgi:VIT1/CCC1 family predicted Fe2+/Mn2+ transporter|nr:VIT1/CCC1 transporter family protein [Nanoarchaeota archaeon]